MRKSMLLPLFTVVLSFFPSTAAQGEQGPETYSWIILAGLLVMLVLLGIILQLRKPRPAGKVKEKELEDVEEEASGEKQITE